MRKRERAVVQTFQRVCDFVWAQRKSLPTFVVDRLLPQLRRSVVRLDELAVEQELGLRLQMAATRRQEALAHTLREQFVLPLSRIAREESPALKAALRAPHKRIPRERLARTAMSMADVCDRQSRLVAKLLGRRFTRDMRAAATALDRAIVAREGPVRRHIVARAAVVAELRAGRKTVRHMEALMRPTLYRDAVLAPTWAKVKRYE
jgi:hypothetical protein